MTSPANPSSAAAAKAFEIKTPCLCLDVEAGRYRLCELHKRIALALDEAVAEETEANCVLLCVDCKYKLAVCSCDKGPAYHHHHIGGYMPCTAAPIRSRGERR